MKTALVTVLVCCVGLAGDIAGQTVRTWTSDSDQRWNRNASWSGNNQPDSSNEIALFGTGLQSKPELNANNLRLRGIRFGTDAASYDVSDDGSRTLKIGNSTSGFIESLAANDQFISIATLRFQSDATISTAGAGGLSISSDLTGSNRNLTFDTMGDISVSSRIDTGNGTLTKQGSGNLNLSGRAAYTGLTTIGAGAIVLEASAVFTGSSAITISSGATLRLNDLTPTIGRVSGFGAIDFGTTGNGRLTLGSGASLFAGSFLGRGELIIGAGATLTLGADFNNPDLNLILDGGTLLLGGYSASFGALDVSANSIIDFGPDSDSSLAVSSLGFGSTDSILTAQNWADAADYFYSQTGYVQGDAPLDQVAFQGWTAADTKWRSYDRQITPVPEPRAYGAALLLAAGFAVWCRRRVLV